MFNKNIFQKFNNKKILHEIGKYWITISLATLMALGIGASITHISANANTVNTQQTLRLNKNEAKNHNQIFGKNKYPIKAYSKHNNSINKSIDYKNHLIFDGKEIYCYESPNNAVDPYSTPTSGDHLHDIYLDGLYTIWSKPSYDVNGHYKYHGHVIINRHEVQALGLERIPFKIYKSHGEQSYGIHSHGISGWVNSDNLYEYDGKTLPITYSNNASKYKAHKLVKKYSLYTIKHYINKKHYKNHHIKYYHKRTNRRIIRKLTKSIKYDKKILSNKHARYFNHLIKRINSKHIRKSTKRILSKKINRKANRKYLNAYKNLVKDQKLLK